MTLRRRITLSVVAVTLLPLLALVAVEYGVEQQHVLAAAGAGHASLAADTLDRLDRFLFERYRNATSWARLEVMGDVAVDDLDRRIVQTLVGLRAEYGVYSGLYCLDAAGKVVADSVVTAVGRWEAESPWFQAIRKGAPTYQEANLKADGGVPEVLFAVPIPAPGGGAPLGVLVARIDPAAVAVFLDGVNLRLAKLGHPVRVAIQAGEEVEPALEKGGLAARVDRLTGEIVGEARSRGYRDFPGFGWVLTLREARASALAPMQRTGLLLQLVGGGTVVVALLLAALLARGLARPLEEITRAAAAIETSGQLGVILPVERPDEIGYLAATFNRMVHRLAEAQATLVRQERLTAIGRVAAEVAHDLATPATTIANLARRLHRNSTEESREAHQLALILDSATYVQGLVRRLLDFAHSESPTTAPVNVGEVVRQAVVQAGGEVDLRVAGVLPAIFGDANALTRMLVNLIRNGREAAGEAGEVAVIAGVTGGAIEITVTDDGPGMDPEVRAHLFEPFITTKGREGTGLGLAIAYRIARDHGGTLQLSESRPGRTTFGIRIPLAPAGPRAAG
ncbi:MAG: HAMP domain-containing protein [Deltaproteobacteria bacterium]|nr:HAMP domain-containing protein [Deltaproteobacteria bacterium]OIP65244.1 MAG: hypothetical protein AUK30_04990 [Nitrospirae bacterium CG2_30_70_394]PIU79846.1 MAG: hypothetical protein COS73_02345 [Nitrospirae bacterium CG06_land_8_20_14_3_00_70_43]PJB96802.1 MAG: hypothetical protein CO080_02100 [Nitrospirae bacterium CG_4_9_14_0_8_um_filter_70_14]HBB39884.1 hypothetical protein [Pseudomonadota bacterium]